MSGGSFNYLFSAELLNQSSDVIDMRDELRALAEQGVPGALTAWKHTDDLIRATQVRSELRDVWKAIEWFRSRDYGRDKVDAALKRYQEVTWS